MYIFSIFRNSGIRRIRVSFNFHPSCQLRKIDLERFKKNHQTADHRTSSLTSSPRKFSSAVMVQSSYHHFWYNVTLIFLQCIKSIYSQLYCVVCTIIIDICNILFFLTFIKSQISILANIPSAVTKNFLKIHQNFKCKLETSCNLRGRPLI